MEFQSVLNIKKAWTWRDLEFANRAACDRVTSVVVLLFTI